MDWKNMRWSEILRVAARECDDAQIVELLTGRDLSPLGRRVLEREQAARVSVPEERVDAS